MPPEIILASGSPRRRELLGKLGVRFEVITADVVELDATSAPDLAPLDLALKNALLKARAVKKLPQATPRWVLGADTVVGLEGRVFGKPASLAQAGEFLRALRGRTHEVITGCVLVDPDGREEIFHDISRVTFRDFTDAVLEEFLAEVPVLDKAGGYALQQDRGRLIQQVEGSLDNVIGFPSEQAARVFKSRGLL